MPTRYTWHPPHPPSPPNATITSKIAAILPVGKCLETALNELREEDQCETHAVRLNAADSEPLVSKNNVLNNSKETNDSSQKKRNAMDQSLTDAIMQSYAQSVTHTTYDKRKKAQSYSYKRDDAVNKLHIPPAALLKGDIEHYNRIGGQWRIVVKNPVLLPRRVKVDMGSSTRGKRLMLDWDDDKTTTNNDLGEDLENRAVPKKRKTVENTEAYRFEGTIQVLAYNDDI